MSLFDSSPIIQNSKFNNFHLGMLILYPMFEISTAHIAILNILPYLQNQEHLRCLLGFNPSLSSYIDLNNWKKNQCVTNYVQPNKYETAPNFIQLSQNLTSDGLLISVCLCVLAVLHDEFFCLDLQNNCMITSSETW